MNFLTIDQVDDIISAYETPLYVYSEQKLRESAEKFCRFPSAFGHTVRYAMKANANINILNIFRKKGLKVDCSSEYEVYRALNAGYEGEDIQISGQETPKSLRDLVEKGVFFVATSFRQIEAVGKIAPGANIGVRINPGSSSGAFAAISTGGKVSAFGIWHEKIPEILDLANSYDLKITKIHFHIGSENTPEAWTQSADTGFEMIRHFPDVEIFDMGGGFKEAIMPYEQSADLENIGKSVAGSFKRFEKETGRKIHLEIEPGKALVINSCSLIAKVDDIVDTGDGGYSFIRTNTGMTEMPRPSMYGVQQPISILNQSSEKQKYVVVGHCCESGDLLTPKLYENETIEEVLLPKAQIADPIVFDGVGAYSSAMSVKNYNSFPEAAEVMILENGEIQCIRTRQDPKEIWKNEILL